MMKFPRFLYLLLFVFVFQFFFSVALAGYLYQWIQPKPTLFLWAGILGGMILSVPQISMARQVQKAMRSPETELHRERGSDRGMGVWFAFYLLFPALVMMLAALLQFHRGIGSVLLNAFFCYLCFGLVAEIAFLPTFLFFIRQMRQFPRNS